MNEKLREKNVTLQKGHLKIYEPIMHHSINLQHDSVLKLITYVRPLAKTPFDFAKQ